MEHWRLGRDSVVVVSEAVVFVVLVRVFEISICRKVFQPMNYSRLQTL